MSKRMLCSIQDVENPSSPKTIPPPPPPPPHSVGSDGKVRIESVSDRSRRVGLEKIGIPSDGRAYKRIARSMPFNRESFKHLLLPHPGNTDFFHEPRDIFELGQGIQCLIYLDNIGYVLAQHEYSFETDFDYFESVFTLHTEISGGPSSYFSIHSSEFDDDSGVTDRWIKAEREGTYKFSWIGTAEVTIHSEDLYFRPISKVTPLIARLVLESQLRRCPNSSKFIIYPLNDSY